MQKLLRNIVFVALAGAGALASTLPSHAAKIGEMCAGLRGIPCDKDLWCDPEPGKCKGADIAGTCISVPTVCTRDYKPVCGCDGKTYGNDCERRAAKVARQSDGACPGYK